MGNYLLGGKRRWLALLMSGMLALASAVAAPGSAADTPIGRIGETLRVEFKTFAADVTVHDVVPAPIPPGFGNPPRPPRQQVYRANVTVHTIKAPNPYMLSVVFSFHGVTPTGDSYEARNNDAPDQLRNALQNAPPGSTVSGGVWWDCYRDLVTNVVLIDRVTGYHLAQWNL